MVDGAGNSSAALVVTAFTVNAGDSGPQDTSPPTLTELLPIATPGNDPTPTCLFHSTEAGTLHWYGDSSSASSVTVAGNNVTVLNALATTPTRTASSS